MILLDGKSISNEIYKTLKCKVDVLLKKKITPTLAIIQIGKNPASEIYVKNKIAKCDTLKIKTNWIKFPDKVNEQKIITTINKLNADKSINGLIVQLPLPKNINEEKIIKAISANKDVDCFNLENVGNLWTKKIASQGLYPCTALGIVLLLKKSSVTLDGKNVVIIGRSNIVGKPLAALLLLENATVTICHTHTKNLASICAKADILVVAIGVANFINAKYTNSHQVIVDVGSNYDKNHKSCGDVDFTAVNNKIAAISKVPGGVGPMTICMLINNLINLTYAQHKLSHKLIY